ncbi:MAG: glycoside hydrolase family 16 protein [Collimonas sp.]|uniref:glycoside hydrolase family 16 protein n=1 Tax=Collimonas sp. TaxID=1963772 RepID=UPI003264C1F1
MKYLKNSLLALAAMLAAGSAMAAADAIFFDDFHYADTKALVAGGWKIRDQQGHPGIEHGHWGPDTISLVDDPELGGERLLRLNARTDGTAPGTFQAQLCHQRKYFEGTYAARIRFSDAPVAGPGGDLVVEAFYTSSPLKHDFDPQYSELDWEYLPNGGWGNPHSRLYSVSWQTVQMEPWNAFNQVHEEQRALGGWHTVMMQVVAGKIRYFLDGLQLDEHGGRNYPALPMSINFNLWFSPSGVLPDTKAQRSYRQDVAWVLHAKDRLLSPAQVDAAVSGYRKAGTHQVDTVPAMTPPLASNCDF